MASVLVVRGSVAGVEKSSIEFAFDSNDKLYAATYILGGLFKNDGSDYEIIEKSLVEKYGDPENTWLPIVNRMSYEPINYLWSWVQEDGSFPDNSSWLVKNEDANVVIVHYIAKADAFGMPMTFHVVGYQQYTVDELSQEINNVSEEADAVEEQRSNDL